MNNNEKIEVVGRFMRWHPSKIARNRRIMMLRRRGKSCKEIAELFGVTPQQIYNICGSGSPKQRGDKKDNNNNWIPFIPSIPAEQIAYDLKLISPHRSWMSIASVLKIDSKIDPRKVYNLALQFAKKNSLPLPTKE